MKIKYLVMLSIATALFSTAAQANKLLDETIVYIKCTFDLRDSNGKFVTNNDGGHKKGESKGTGILVSSDGKVLTAKHVIPKKEDNGICFGNIGNTFDQPPQLKPDIQSLNFDAALLKFVKPGVKFNFLKYCSLDDSFRKATVFATGFPAGTQSGSPSSRKGVLSTIESDDNGFIETDSATTSGMSGGMITLGGSSHLVGIIAGAEFDPKTGVPSYYGVLPIDKIANELHLSKEDEPCISKLPEKVEWHSGMSSLELGVKTDEGYCFLTDVWGDFNHEKDKVAIEVNDDNEFILTGTKDGGGKHGGSARCVWF